ncbi:hypothetical protein [Rhizobium sp. AN80A]|uniref:hypothetical protein n=1 Tax=Rhizobium sp. AN80A TaxID=3040673 RepID=UPI0024B33715|nr:hypothetical protein [Rhizobium sp. AN80A]
MGLIAMSERDLQRIEILSKVIAGRMTVVSAAHVLDLSERQGRRLPGTRPRRPFCVAVSTDPIDARCFRAPYVRTLNARSVLSAIWVTA